MYTCANCNQLACAAGTRENLPSNCPMRQEQKLWELFNEYQTDDNHRFYVTSSSMEAAGYGQWPRLRETIEFCKAMGYQRVGIAFCKGLRKEARVVAGLLQKHHFQVVSVICKPAASLRKRRVSPRRISFIPMNLKPCAIPSHRPLFSTSSRQSLILPLVSAWDMIPCSINTQKLPSPLSSPRTGSWPTIPAEPSIARMGILKTN